MATEVKVPALGESITEAVVLEWLVQPGDWVALDQEIVALETDKITVNMPSPVAGKLLEQKVAPDEEVEIGAVIALIDESAEQGSDEASAEPEPSKAQEPSAASSKPPQPALQKRTPKPAPAEQAPKPASASSAAPPSMSATVATPEGPALARRELNVGGAAAKPFLTPAVRRLVAEHGLDPSLIPGTGPGGRILKEDVLRYIDSGQAAQAKGADEAPPAQPSAPSAAPAAAQDDPREEVVRMSKLRRTIASRLVEAQQNAAILTTFNEIDMSAVMALRKTYRDAFEKKHGVRLGFTSFFAKAAIEALKAVPAVNAEIRDETIVYKNHYDIGVAVGGGRGLVVPVIKDADRLSFADFELKLNALADKAKDNRLSLDDLSGGTFTISNGGVYGSLLSTPILNPPQSGILGLHKIEQRPVAVDGEVVIRPMMYVALSYDHRIIDGREAVTFLVRVKECIEDPSRMLIEV